MADGAAECDAQQTSVPGQGPFRPAGATLEPGPAFENAWGSDVSAGSDHSRISWRGCGVDCSERSRPSSTRLLRRVERHLSPNAKLVSGVNSVSSTSFVFISRWRVGSASPLHLVADPRLMRSERVLTSPFLVGAESSYGWAYGVLGPDGFPTLFRQTSASADVRQVE